MYNPSYLIKSRHDIYYFRYPLPIKSSRQNNRICISLGTRCPREALRLSKALEYHSVQLFAHMQGEQLEPSQAMTVLKDRYAKVLQHPTQTVHSEEIQSPRIIEGTIASHSACKLGRLIETYLAEIRPGIGERGYKEQADILGYLIDWLGNDYPAAKINDAKAREVKELLRSTPKQRNKMTLTAGKPLTEQIKITEEKGLELLSETSINKYLGYFGSLFIWAKRNRYVSDNPFLGIKVKASKKKNRRDLFDKEEVAQIIKGLGNGTPDKLVKNKSNYWGALIAIYTGARRNEIAALLPEDVKHDPKSGIWYFDITDEDEAGKALKTEASKRIVPVHSRLIEMGFLKFVEEARIMKNKIKHDNGYEPRLLYHLTYTDHEKWGRNLGRWFNEQYLKEIGLKSKKKTLHSLRHSLITYLSTAGVDGATIKSVVGHEPDTVTTMVYTHYGVEHLPVFKAALEKLPY